jgi:hypothetical protein
MHERRTYLPSIQELQRREADEVPDPSAPVFSVLLPLGTSRTDFALIGRERVQIGAGAKVLEPRQGKYQWGAFVATMGSLELGAGGRVGGIYNLGHGPVVIEDRASVSGYIKAAGEVQRTNRSALRVGSMDHAPQDLEVYSFSVAFPEHAADATASDPAQPLELAAGGYGRVSVEPGCLLKISKGHYTLRALHLAPGAQLEIDNSGGPVHLWVRDALELGGETTSLSPLRNVFVGFAGGSPLELVSPFRGTLLAPNAEVQLHATADRHEGSIFARAIVVANGAELEQHHFSDEPEPRRSATN